MALSQNSLEGQRWVAVDGELEAMVPCTCARWLVVRRSRLSGHGLRFVVGVHETAFRVNVRWVTPLGEETASTS